MIVLSTALLLASGLYDQAVERILLQRFGGVEYIVIDAHTEQVIAKNWRDVARPIPAGSLTKPFLAVHLPADRYVRCERGCWLAGGHGRVNLREAIALSCNQYFLQSELPPNTRVPGASAGADAATLLGLRGDFRIAPLVLARGYREIVRDVASVRDGLRLAVRRGTARAVQSDALAKTGTARCSHVPNARGDGLVIVLWPSADPAWILLVRLHGTTGAVAAATAGQMLRVISDAR